MKECNSCLRFGIICKEKDGIREIYVGGKKIGTSNVLSENCQLKSYEKPPKKPEKP
jgi:hypothetical protein